MEAFRAKKKTEKKNVKIENKNSDLTVGVRQWVPFITAMVVVFSGALTEELMCLRRRALTELYRQHDYRKSQTTFTIDGEA